MDAFEQVVSEILWREGYWVRTSVKVDLTKEEKREIGRPSSPRWELDIVAYSGRDNLLRVVECKSYLDNPGVGIRWLHNWNAKAPGRYKLFSDSKLCKVVLNRLSLQFVAAGMCLPNPKIRLSLVCGKIQNHARPGLEEHFKKNGWDLLDQKWLRESLEKMSAQGYENQVSAVVAKLLLRGSLK
jgi:hypothetical protein